MCMLYRLPEASIPQHISDCALEDYCVEKIALLSVSI